MQEQIGAKKLARPDPTRRIALCLSGKMKCRYLGISYFIYEQFKSQRLTHNLLSSTVPLLASIDAANPPAYVSTCPKKGDGHPRVDCTPLSSLLAANLRRLVLSSDWAGVEVNQVRLSPLLTLSNHRSLRAENAYTHMANPFAPVVTVRAQHLLIPTR